jgi:hypothetical protein
VVARGRLDKRFVAGQPTFALGQSRRFDHRQITSGLPLGADIFDVGRHVSMDKWSGTASVEELAAVACCESATSLIFR